jgi:hypothetical protein
MAFKLEVRFSGICAFVLNSASDQRVKACVLLPDGRGKTVEVGSALDGTRLRRHLAFISFRVKDLQSAGSTADDLIGIRYLDAERLTLKTSGGSNPFKVDLKTIAELEKVAPTYGDIDPAFLQARPKLVAQFLIDQGYLKASPPQYEWVFPNTLSTNQIVGGGLSHEAILVLKHLKSATLMATSFNGGAPEYLSFQAPNKATVSITIANLCDVNPLRWATEYSELPPDDDFKWYYELLAKRKHLHKVLKGLPLPSPQPIRAMPNGQGMNCLHGHANPAPINLDKFLSG